MTLPPAPPPRPEPGASPRLLRVLEAEGLYAFPPDLAAAILESAIGARRRSPRERIVRAAAAVLVALAAWSAWLGEAPGPDAAVAPDWLRPPLTLPAVPLLARAPEASPSLAPWIALASLALLAATPRLVRRLVDDRNA